MKISDYKGRDAIENESIWETNRIEPEKYNNKTYFWFNLDI